VSCYYVSSPLPPSSTSIAQTAYAINTTSILRDFGLENLAQELLVTDNVHDPGNLRSFETNVRTCFDRAMVRRNRRGSFERPFVRVTQLVTAATTRLSSRVAVMVSTSATPLLAPRTQKG
jgi:hypothetical protein